MARARLPISPRGAPMMDLATLARRRQAMMPTTPPDAAQTPPSPGLPTLQAPSMTMPQGSLQDGTPAFSKGGRQTISEPSAIVALRHIPKGTPLIATLDEFGRRQPETISISHPGKTLKGAGAFRKGVRPYDEGGDLNDYTGGQGGTQTLTYNNTDQPAAAPQPGAPAVPQQQDTTPGPVYPSGQGSGLGSGNYNAGNLVGSTSTASTGPTQPNIDQYQAQQAAFDARQAALNAAAGVYPAQWQQTAAKGASLDAQGGVVAAQAGQTSAQRAFYAEQQRAAQQELDLERRRQAAQADVGNLQSVANQKTIRGVQDRQRAAFGVDKLQDVILPPGYNGPALGQGTRPAIESNEEVLAREEGNAAAVNKQLSAEGSAAVGTAGTNVSTAQQGATLADIAAQRAGLAVDTAQQQAGMAGNTAQQESLAEERTKAPPAAGLQWDELVGQFVTPDEYAQSHALNRYQLDPISHQRVTSEDLASRTDNNGNIVDPRTGELTDPNTGNVFRDGNWTDPDNGNIFVKGHWWDPKTGNWFVFSGGGAVTSPHGGTQQGGEWHRMLGTTEQRLDSVGQWVNVKGAGAVGGLDASGNPVAATDGAGAGANNSGLSAAQ